MMTVIFLTTADSSPWAVPSDWNNSANSIECIGGGAGGRSYNNASAHFGTGGGGGAYSKITNLMLTPAAGIQTQIGSGGSGDSAGGNTWFNGTSLASASVSAEGGQISLTAAGGVGGNAANGIGTVKFSGGAGGSSTNAFDGGAGGGGAAGPNGAGAAGDQGNTNNGAAGGTADNGSGGAGGAGVAVPNPGNPGGNGTEFDASHGGGGGGGGGADNGSTTQATNGGNGGLYGGGGGSSAYIGATGGSGGGGLIVITYTPAASETITTECGGTIEVQTTGCKTDLCQIEASLTIRSDSWPPISPCGGIRKSAASVIGFFCAACGDAAVPTEWRGAVAVIADALLRLEAARLLRSDASDAIEFVCAVLRNDAGLAEWHAMHAVYASPAVEYLARAGGGAIFAIEAIANGALISAAGLLDMEWADPPALLVIPPERLLRSPGRIRVLAGPGGLHPLRAY